MLVLAIIIAVMKWQECLRRLLGEGAFRRFLIPAIGSVRCDRIVLCLSVRRDADR